MRRRGRNPNANPGVRPVERIELTEKGSKKRMIAAIILLALGLSLVAYAMTSWLTQKPGWVEITPTSASAESVAGDLVFQYELGASELSSTAERKAVSTLYTNACAEAYRIFSANSNVLGVNNLCYINEHIGEEITVDSALYEALALLEKHDNRMIYLAPLLTDYKNLFLCSEDHETAEFDPYQNEEVAAYCKTVAAFANDKNAINLELLGENKVKLTVSDAYLAFAEENAIETFLDFFTMKNAFAVDYVAEKLMAAGYTNGNITSYDGFTRNLDQRATAYSLNLFDRIEDNIYVAARLDYAGAKSIVFLRSYSLSEHDDTYYMMKNGETRHGHIDPADGLCKNSLENLVCYSESETCAEILLSMLPAYVNDVFEQETLMQLTENGIYAVWFDGTEIVYTESDAVLNAFYINETVEFTKKWAMPTS